MPRRRVTRRQCLGLLATAGAAGSAGCGGLLDGSEATTDPGANASGATPSTTADSTADRRTAPGERGTDAASPYAAVYRETIGSVVMIRTFTSTGSGQGSGWVYDGEGHVVTNQHVVEGTSELNVRFEDGEWRTASIVGTDAYSDLAVLEVPDVPSYATPLSFVPETPPIGTEVVALGAPFGFEQSASAGIVSGTGRSIPAPNNFVIPDTIQTDAAVNPGNSGGPLVTLAGNVAGIINSGIASSTGDNVSFAISAALAERVVPSLVENGEYRHSYVGIRTANVTPIIAEANDLSEPRGVLVTDVLADGPSDGVLRGSDGETTVNGVTVPTGGDVIVALDGRPIESQQGLSTHLALETSPGETLSITVLRDGERRTVEVTLGRRPAPASA